MGVEKNPYEYFEYLGHRLEGFKFHLIYMFRGIYMKHYLCWEYKIYGQSWLAAVKHLKRLHSGCCMYSGIIRDRQWGDVLVPFFQIFFDEIS